MKKFIAILFVAACLACTSTASAQCANGSCGVSGQPVRNVLRAAARGPRRLFAGRPVRSFLGRLFGGCN